VIKYSLCCDNAHTFEGWFSGSAEYDRQVDHGLITCPTCGSGSISKSLMAPAVSTARKQEAKKQVAMDVLRRDTMAKLKEMVSSIRANAEDVGERFAEEARKIHYGEADARGIIGQASLGEVRDLLEEGVDVAPLPVLPDEAN
jgi:hypothetical protein